MSHTKEIATALGTLAVAVGIGFVMQNSEAAKQRYGTTDAPTPPVNLPVEPEETAVLGTSMIDDAVLQVQSIQLMAAVEDTTLPLIQEAPTLHQVTAPNAVLPDSPPSEITAKSDCTIDARAETRPAAMVALKLAAPCMANQRLTVHHMGMMFSAITDSAGGLSVTVPALAHDAVFILAFANGDGTITKAEVSDINQYDRTVLQWRGHAGFQLHAREFGAGYGTPGHVWGGIDQNVTGIVRGDNGFVHRLGNAADAEPLMAEIYTYPSGRSARSGTIDLSVEAEVSEINCGHEIEAQTLEREYTGTIRTRDLMLAVPDCSARGSFLVLNNLVSDLKVASN